MTFVPQTDPKAGYLAHRAEIDEAIKRVLESGWFILGREVEAFEQEFAAYIRTKHAIGVASGTNALELALRACGIGRGDLVLTVSHTAVATVAAIELVDAVPIFVDIDLDTYTLDPNSLEKVLSSPQTGIPKAVIPVHLYGQPADMPAIMELARRYGLYVIEDCAQSHGAVLEECMTGSWGDIAAFSFYPTKNLGALGDGGMIATNRPELAEKVRLLRQYGWRQRFVSETPGLNSRLDELQAAVLRTKLRYLSEDNSRRIEIAREYDRQLAGSGLVLPSVRPQAHHVYHQYVARSPQRDELAQKMKQEGVGTAVHYPVPVHLQPAYQGRILEVAQLPNTELATKQILSLPMYPQLTESQIEHICSAVVRYSRPAGGSV